MNDELTLTGLHYSLMQEALRHGTAHANSRAERHAVAELIMYGYVGIDNRLTALGREYANRG